jgi:hypothetical protein
MRLPRFSWQDSPILSSGDIQSNIFPALQIVSQEVFNKAQERSTKYAERRIPLNTRGNALLSGNIFCGHCGGRLTLTTNGKKYCRKNGDVTIIPKLRYVYYNKTRHSDRCNGQTGYTTHKLDTMIDDVLQKFFSKVKEKSDRQSISMHLKREIGLFRVRLEMSKAEIKRELQTLSALEDELINVIQGKSAFKSEILNSKYRNTKINIESKQLEISILERKIANKHDFMSRIAKQHEDALSLANMYSNGGIAEKKMIVVQFIKEIRVSRGY